VFLGTQLNKSCTKNFQLQNIEAYGTHNYQCALESFKRFMTNKQPMLLCVTFILHKWKQLTHSELCLYSKCWFMGTHLLTR